LIAHNGAQGTGGGPAADLVKAQTTANTSRTTAVSLDQSFGLGANPNIENAATVPHATIRGVSNGSGSEFYSFTVAAANTTVTFDVDGTTGFDSTLAISTRPGRSLPSMTTRAEIPAARATSTRA
jgi:serralysin